MRYPNALAITAVAVFLIGTNSTEVFAKRPSNPPELEQRVTDLEGQVADQEARIGDLETNNATQDSQIADHETRIDELEQQAPVLPGIKVYDANDLFVGFLVSLIPEGYRTQKDTGMSPHVTIFVPSVRKFLELQWYNPGISPTTRTVLYRIFFDGPDCTGNAYVESPPSPNAGNVLTDPYYLYRFFNNQLVQSFYVRGQEVMSLTLLSKLNNSKNCINGLYDGTYVTLLELEPLFDNDNNMAQMPLRFE